MRPATQRHGRTLALPDIVVEPVARFARGLHRRAQLRTPQRSSEVRALAAAGTKATAAATPTDAAAAAVLAPLLAGRDVALFWDLDNVQFFPPAHTAPIQARRITVGEVDATWRR